MKRERTIQSINRAMELLSLFTHGRSRLGITEMSHNLGLAKGTVHGLVRTLLRLGFLQQDSESGKYCLGLKIYELGVVLAGTLEINDKGAIPAHQLAKRTRLVSRIAIWDGESGLITLNVDPRFHSLSLFIHQIGPRAPAYSSGVGKALLGYIDRQELKAYLARTKLIGFTPHTIVERKHLLKDLEETRLRGYSIDREETMLGLSCIGAPIFGRGGRLEGSISLSGDTHRVSGKNIERLAKELLKTAGEISGLMGYNRGF